MVEAFEVCVPVADVLVIEPVDDVFSQDQIGQERIRTPGEEVRRDQVCPMDLGTSVTAADCGQHLVAQPGEVRLQLRQDVCRCKISRERLMPVEQMGWMFLHDE